MTSGIYLILLLNDKYGVTEHAIKILCMILPKSVKITVMAAHSKPKSQHQKTKG
jgi:hypothetical protein